MKMWETCWENIRQYFKSYLAEEKIVRLHLVPSQKGASIQSTEQIREGLLIVVSHAAIHSEVFYSFFYAFFCRRTCECWLASLVSIHHSQFGKIFGWTRFNVHIDIYL